MAKRIAILGGPRCGKTTLVQQLFVDMKICGHDVGYALEYSTEYLRDKGMIESIAEQYGIYLGQKRLEKKLEVFDYAITDYATFVPYIYGRFMLGSKKRSQKEVEILKDLYIIALEEISEYDHIFYLPREFGYEKDGVRWQDLDLAKGIDEAILSFLKSENIKYDVISGATKKRAQDILEILQINTSQLDETK